ncbi:biosynthetic-type acetolactate synthase large subunit [Clostridia bacterium OttesenSCG-928-F22]|nr:biosynthetic-type acetolactate synthase large subunit [Clostridia bacterium OttesenSCG-928-F22]
MNLTGAQILIQSILDMGVDTVFGYPGGAVLNIYDALHEKKEQIRHIVTSHEQGAAHAADGYARSTGKTGVVIATSGPGATNLVTGIATAYHDSVPLVAITGNVSRDLIGRDSFQEVDIVAITSPVVKHNFFVQDVEELASTVRLAFEIANSGRKGPVLIDIPKDITALQADYQPLEPYSLRPVPTPSERDYENALKALLVSKKPLIYCGGGVTFGDCGDELLAFAQKLHAPICQSMMGLSAFPHNAPLSLGLVGMHGTPAANRSVSECDLLIAVGARFSDRVAGNRKLFAHNAKVLHIDLDPTEISKNVSVHLPLLGDAKACLMELTKRLPQQQHQDWVHSAIRQKAIDPLPLAQSSNDEVNPREIIQRLPQALGTDAIIATDVGQHQMLVAQYYPFTQPRTFISSCGLGTMGYGMGAANGAAIGNPGKKVALITGDGSFHMNLSELAVAVTNKLPVLVLVMNNQVLGMVHQWQNLFYGGRYSNTELGRKTDFVKLAQAFGAKGLRINRPEDISPVLEEAAQTQGPCVVDCVITAKERVFPIIPPGGRETDMIYTEKYMEEVR